MIKVPRNQEKGVTFSQRTLKTPSHAKVQHASSRAFLLPPHLALLMKMLNYAPGQTVAMSSILHMWDKQSWVVTSYLLHLGFQESLAVGQQLQRYLLPVPTLILGSAAFPPVPLLPPASIPLIYTPFSSIPLSPHPDAHRHTLLWSYSFWGKSFLPIKIWEPLGKNKNILQRNYRYTLTWINIKEYTH